MRVGRWAGKHKGSGKGKYGSEEFAWESGSDRMGIAEIIVIKNC